MYRSTFLVTVEMLVLEVTLGETLTHSYVTSVDGVVTARSSHLEEAVKAYNAGA